ncbi:hypothetical protein F9802_08885 [Bacillus aerolatus]|uniref:DUF1832 domain-containing protein n=1 Tax=Bacillus aerolatus TaxID=2653354 RepID=A0A6I1FK71_9BACI|nr:hypothetical protein [Bacillus aerolatus]KAB7707116.1 hypothetical protein F9802_08885 [Bacillus aerolatus]
MSNRKMNLSKDGKDILDLAEAELELERPLVIKVALAKGLSSEEQTIVDASSTPKWTIPDNIIKNEEFLMFKHLIIHKANKPLNEEDVHKQMIFYIEKGLRLLKQSFQQKGSISDSRLAILN